METTTFYVSSLEISQVMGSTYVYDVSYDNLSKKVLVELNIVCSKLPFNKNSCRKETSQWICIANHLVVFTGSISSRL